MTNRNILLILGIGLLAVTAARGANNTLGSIGFKAAGFKLGRFGFPTQLAVISMVVSNPTRVPFKIDSFIGSIQYAGQSLASMQRSDIELSADGDTRIDFNVRIDWSQLLTSLSNIVAAGNILSQARLVGTATVGQLNIPVDKTLLNLG